MPDANKEIRSVMLYRDERTRARTLTVEFPPGFSRPVPGRYQAGEELLVLAGELDLDGLRLEAGDWAWLPPRLVRGNLASGPGAVVYAWFSAGNDWERSQQRLPGLAARAERVGAGNAAPRQLRGGAAGDGPGSSAVVAPGAEVAGPAELLDLKSFAWNRLEEGERRVAGPGPALVRWPGSFPGPAGTR